MFSFSPIVVPLYIARHILLRLISATHFIPRCNTADDVYPFIFSFLHFFSKSRHKMCCAVHQPYYNTSLLFSFCWNTIKDKMKYFFTFYIFKIPPLPSDEIYDFFDAFMIRSFLTFGRTALPYFFGCCRNSSSSRKLYIGQPTTFRNSTLLL